MRVALHSTVKRPIAPDAPVPDKLFARDGADVVLGEEMTADGLPIPLLPSRSTFFGPRGVCFVKPGGPFIVSDTGHHRVLLWRQVPDKDNAEADLVFGQPDFNSEGRNGKADVGPVSFNMPTGISSDGEMVAIADAWNHRILIWRKCPETSNQPADLVLGQPDFVSSAANRGQSAPSPDSLYWCYGVTIADGRLYVADTGNRRVLVWNSIPEHNGQPADLVLGQAEMSVRDDNGGAPTDAAGMRWPHAVVVSDGKIVVTDAGNNRIMVWNNMPNTYGSSASFVLGQSGFGSNDHNRSEYYPTGQTLQMPYGIVVRDGKLLCADTANSRIVGFDMDGIDMGACAEALAGQPNFAAKGDNRWRAATRDSLCWPFSIATCAGFTAVADTGNNRVLLWRSGQ